MRNSQMEICVVKTHPHWKIAVAGVLLLSTLAACKQQGALGQSVNGTSDGVIVADVSDHYCTQIPADQLASYKAATDQFSGPAGLTPRSEEHRLGTGGSVRVDLGGRRLIKKKKKQQQDQH